jgi:hypothetical protein
MRRTYKNQRFFLKIWRILAKNPANLAQNSSLPQRSGTTKGLLSGYMLVFGLSAADSG